LEKGYEHIRKEISVRGMVGRKREEKKGGPGKG
jgi:hypothetical protein